MQPARPYSPQVNITMPVYNRHELTLQSILAVHEHTATPYTLTVVDNGSDAALRTELLSLHKHGIISNLYFLDENYGVSAACNIGWRLHNDSICMKLDNDMLVVSDTWLTDILTMWGKARYSTIFGPVWNCARQECRIDTPQGVYWTIPVSVSGAAFLVTRKTLDTVGYFCEDYGVYGDEDADYCLRCHHAGIRKYTFEAAPLVQHKGDDDAEYHSNNINKIALHNKNVGKGTQKGLFSLNLFLYKHKLKNLCVLPKYEIGKVQGQHVTLVESEAYARHHAALLECAKIFSDTTLEEGLMLEKLANTLHSAASATTEHRFGQR